MVVVVVRGNRGVEVDVTVRDKVGYGMWGRRSPWWNDPDGHLKLEINTSDADDPVW